MAPAIEIVLSLNLAQYGGPPSSLRSHSSGSAGAPNGRLLCYSHCYQGPYVSVSDYEKGAKHLP
jgi:hypothetical protein